jgi:hypothetical protein
MSDVEFDTDTQGSAMRRPEPAAGFGQTSSQASGMAGWLIRHGLAKSPASAQAILVVIILADIVGSFVLIKYFL